MELAQVQAALPQRYPLLLVDRVLTIQPGQSIETVKAISASDPCYSGVPVPAAPGDYAYPISLLIESFGQSAALLWLGENGVNGDGNVLLFVGARRYRVEGRAYPGDVVRHVVRLEQVVANTAFASGESWVGERRIASVGSLMAACRPKEALDLQERRETSNEEDRHVH